MAHLTTIARDPLLDLDPWVGQRSCTFRFYVTDAVSKLRLGTVTPTRGASLTHDTGRTIKRQLQLALGTADSASINPSTDRIDPYMVFASGAEYPLGRYMFNISSYQQFTSGNLASTTLSDEMFLVDQQIRKGFDSTNLSVVTAIKTLLHGLPVEYQIEPSLFVNNKGSWSIGANRGQIIEALALAGGYFSPWFNNHGIMRMIRSFNPMESMADIDFDIGKKVLRSSIIHTDDLLTAPNVIIVVANSSSTPDKPVTAIAEIPVTAPNSIANRGFEIPLIVNLQLTSVEQAQAAANGIAQRSQIAERVTITTPPDPRHDSYNVIHWQDENWLELSWSMALVEGGTMNHLLRKAYR